MNLNLKSETAAAVVAGSAFFASAAHIVTVVHETNHIVFSLAYPIGIDGLIYVGIRAVQAGRRFAGMVALLVGAFYSLAFNADAENAVHMDKLLIASSMPVCLFVAFLIEATAPKAKEEDVPAPAPIVKVVPPALLPIVPFVPKQDGMKAGQFRGRTVHFRPEPKAASTGGRAAAWDVPKAIVLIRDEKTNEEIASILGTNAKAIQRTRRALVLIADGLTDEEIVTTMKNAVSLAHVARVRAAQ